MSVINYKGGVGKTTLTANIGAELAVRRRWGLLVDPRPSQQVGGLSGLRKGLEKVHESGFMRTTPTPIMSW